MLETNDTYKPVILLVDDKPANILVLENLLDSADRVLLKAHSGAEALKTAFDEEIDLIILDVQMPDMDGFEVAQTLKSRKKTKNIPIIFATAESKERNFIMKGYGEGGIDYLFKPLDPDIVKAKVNVLLRLQLQQKELLEKNISLQNSALLINNSADILGIVDRQTFVIEEMNQSFSRTLGFDKDSLPGQKLTSFFSDEDAARVAELVRTHTERFSFETNMSCEDGSFKWINWNIVVSHGKLFVNARDVTEQKTSEQRIRQLNDDLRDNLDQLEISNKELESFSYSVSHDLRAPLRALSGYSNILQQDYGKLLDDEGTRLLKNIQSNAQRMGNLIDDLLAFSRLGRKEVQKAACNMNRIVENVLDEIRRSSPYLAEVHVGDLPPAQADHALIHQVWINLISNAIKYSSRKEQPLVEIGARQDTGETIYFVKDNGAGFDMQYADKLFGVFQRLHKTTEFEGTGVGLAIVRKIVNRHGGRIWAEAKKNEGAIFYFTLADN